MATVISIPEGVRQTAVTRIGVGGQLRSGRGWRGGVALTGITISSGPGAGHYALRYHRNTPAALFARTFLTLSAAREFGHNCRVPLDNFSTLWVAFLHFIMVNVIVVVHHAIVTFRGWLEVGDKWPYSDAPFHEVILRSKSRVPIRPREPRTRTGWQRQLPPGPQVPDARESFLHFKSLGEFYAELHNNPQYFFMASPESFVKVRFHDIILILISFCNIVWDTQTNCLKHQILRLT